MNRTRFFSFALIFAVLLPILGKAIAGDDIPRMTKDELKAVLDAEDVTILDARTGRDWKSSEFKIKGAIRTDPGQIGKWSKSLKKDNRLVLYCA